jgi:hypothetical protein
MASSCFVNENKFLYLTFFRGFECFKCLRQVTLSGEVLLEYRYYVIGFVPVDVVKLEKDVWFRKLNSEQVSSVEEFLSSSEHSF